jgi:hypothetical protein
LEDDECFADDDDYWANGDGGYDYVKKFDDDCLVMVTIVLVWCTFHKDDENIDDDAAM